MLSMRKDKNYTQKELASLLGVSFQTISKWERGLGYPDIELLPKLADCLDTSIDTLMGHVPGEYRHTIYFDLYQQDEYYWGTEPTPICYKVLEMYPPNKHLRLLEIGCGEGRDAVFFARNGYDVSAFDITPEGVSKTKRLASFFNVPINTFCADMLDYRPKENYDVIYASRSLHYIPRDKLAETLELYKAHTNTGGLNAFMVFVDKKSVEKAPDKEDNVYLLSSGEIFTIYHDWDFLYIDEKVIDCNSSGVPHKHCVNIMLAVKP